VTIGVKRDGGWSVISAADTIHDDETLAAKRAEQAVQKGAANAGEERSLAQIVPLAKRSGGYKAFRFAGVDDLQRAKAVAFPTLDGFVPAYETIVTDAEGAEPIAYRMFVDGRSGAILARGSIVHQASDEQAQGQAAPVTETFEGTLPAEDGGCGPRHGAVHRRGRLQRPRDRRLRQRGPSAPGHRAAALPRHRAPVVGPAQAARHRSLSYA
jgi:hypothetical protein